MPQITIELEGVARVTRFYNNGLPISFKFVNNQIVISLTGSVSIHVEGEGTSCFSSVQDAFGGVIRARKAYLYNDNGGAVIRYFNF